MVFNALVFLFKSRWIYQIRALAELIIHGPHIQEQKSQNANFPTHLKLYQGMPRNSFEPDLYVLVVNARAGLNIDGDFRSRSKNAKPDSLRIALSKYRGLEATDPRDKVYAFMGIAEESLGDKNELDLVPDYSRSVEGVYIDTCSSIIRTTGSLDILSLKEIQPNRTLPS